ncbi:YdgH/BhsA/McbA-like domain containing protein [Erwinia sp. AnSW2-5]|uniref:YdgH/BhsA/McbA-like domain containing protein n=1 Tax=Erwinia sp. AnSW2-5 TaxID=3367692 RepID=UPI003858C5E0
MKQFIVIAALLLAGVQAFNASAAQEITREKAQEMKLEKIGTVTTNSTTSPMDAHARLSDKADAKGGKYFVIIAAQEGNRDHALADVYK